MIADAINRVLTAKNLEGCIDVSGEDGGGGGGGVEAASGSGANETVFVSEGLTLEFCDQTKVDIAITLAFTTGMIMVHVQLVL